MFEKNIQALTLQNKELAEKIQSVTLQQAQESISLAKNANEDLVLIKNNIPVDDIQSPYDYSKRHILENVKSELRFNDFIIIFGLGLGYLTDVAFQNLPAKIIVFEPDLNILRFVFEAVDLTPYLNSGRVFLSNDLKHCSSLISEKYLINDKIEILYLSNYAATNVETFTKLSEQIVETCQSKIMDVNTIKTASKYWVRNILTHSQLCEEFCPVNFLENKFQGKTALILAGGPSLKDNLSFIKQNRNKFVIFAINRSLNSLMNNNIIPDFTVLTDAQHLITTFNPNNEFLSKVNFIVNLKTDYYVYQIPSKRIFIEFPSDNGFSEKLKEKLPAEIKLYEPSSNATLGAYNLALKMGFKEFIFIGMDLAFRGDEAYADKINVKIIDNKYHYPKSSKDIIDVKSVTGNLVKTRDDYAVFVKHFEKVLTRKPNDITVYNTTDFGAFIEGMIYKPLNEIQLQSKLPDFYVEDILKSVEYNPTLIKNVEKEILKQELNDILTLKSKISDWINNKQNSENFFIQAQEIISRISVTLLLSTYLQAELLDYAKNILYQNDTEKRNLILKVFNNALNGINFINNIVSLI